MTTEGAALKEGTRSDDARGQCQHKNARAEGIFHAPDVIAPGMKMKSASMIECRIFRNFGTGRLLPTNFCTRSRSWKRRSRTKSPEEQKDDRDAGHHNTQVRAVEIVMRGFRVSRSWNMMTMKMISVTLMIPGTTYCAEPVNRFDLQEIAPTNIFILGFEFVFINYRPLRKQFSVFITPP